MTVVAIHQPNFLPHLGYFSKMAACDVFVLLDDAQFPRNSYVNRVRMLFQAGEGADAALKGRDGRYWVADWATIPVPKSIPLDTAICDVQISADGPWVRKFLMRLEQSYGKSPGFESVFPVIEYTIKHRPEMLVALNVALLELVRVWLGFDMPMLRASEVLPRPFDAAQQSEGASERLAALVAAAGGSVYFSGPSGRGYLDEAAFAGRGIEVRYTSHSPFPYEQPVDAFVPGLSVLDALFNLGAESTATLVRRCVADGGGCDTQDLGTMPEVPQQE